MALTIQIKQNKATFKAGPMSGAGFGGKLAEKWQGARFCKKTQILFARNF
jgi:hypothetical protein